MKKGDVQRYTLLLIIIVLVAITLSLWGPSLGQTDSLATAPIPISLNTYSHFKIDDSLLVQVDPTLLAARYGPGSVGYAPIFSQAGSLQVEIGKSYPITGQHEANDGSSGLWYLIQFPDLGNDLSGWVPAAIGHLHQPTLYFRLMGESANLYRGAGRNFALVVNENFSSSQADPPICYYYYVYGDTYLFPVLQSNDTDDWVFIRYDTGVITLAGNPVQNPAAPVCTIAETDTPVVGWVDASVGKVGYWTENDFISVSADIWDTFNPIDCAGCPTPELFPPTAESAIDNPPTHTLAAPIPTTEGCPGCSPPVPAQTPQNRPTTDPSSPGVTDAPPVLTNIPMPLTCSYSSSKSGQGSKAEYTINVTVENAQGGIASVVYVFSNGDTLPGGTLITWKPGKNDSYSVTITVTDGAGRVCNCGGGL